MEKTYPDRTIIQTAKMAPQKTTKKRILIIEDDQNTGKFLSYRLRKLNFEVLLVDDGEKGLSEAKRESPDLVILDLGLPRLSGEEVCKSIREDHNKKFARTPIIMLTARNSDVDRVIGKVIGANCYMVKPFEADALLKEIRKLF